MSLVKKVVHILSQCVIESIVYRRCLGHRNGPVLLGLSVYHPWVAAVTQVVVNVSLAVVNVVDVWVVILVNLCVDVLLLSVLLVQVAYTVGVRVNIATTHVVVDYSLLSVVLALLAPKIVGLLCESSAYILGAISKVCWLLVKLNVS